MNNACHTFGTRSTLYFVRSSALTETGGARVKERKLSSYIIHTSLNGLCVTSLLLCLGDRGHQGNHSATASLYHKQIDQQVRTTDHSTGSNDSRGYQPKGCVASVAKAITEKLTQWPTIQDGQLKVRLSRQPTKARIRSHRVRSTYMDHRRK